MSTAAKKLLTPQEYLTQERQAGFRSEFYRGETFAMSGASWNHARIKDNIARAAANQLEDSPCQIVTSDLRVKVEATGLYTYPDVIVVCEEPQFEDEVFDTLTNPRVIVEVLSPSTESYDRGIKFGHYRQLASVKEFILVAQDRPSVERFVRQADGSWLLTTYGDLSQAFVFGTIDAQIPLAEIYRSVHFSSSGDAPKHDLPN